MQPSFLVRWGREFSAQWPIAGPVILTIFASIGMLTTDVLMVAPLGVIPLGAIGLATGALYTFLLASTGLLTMATVRASYAHGQNNPAGVTHSVRQGLGLGFFMAIPITLLCLNLGYILLWLDQEAAVVKEVDHYMGTAVWCILPQILFSALRGFVSTLARGQLIAAIMVLGLLLNFFLDYIFIYGHWGFPAMGVAGAGLATSIICWLMLMALAVQIAKDPILKTYRIFKKWAFPDFQECKEILRSGWPVAAINVAENSLFLAVSLTMGAIGAVELAAANIVISYMTVAFIVPIGLLYTSSIRVAYFMGQKNIRQARMAGTVSLSTGFLYMVVMASITVLFPLNIIHIYLQPDQENAFAVIEMASQFLFICAFFQVFDSTQAIAGGALRGLKDTMAAFWAGTTGYWIIGYPLGWILCFSWGIGAAGIWWGLAAGIATAAILLTVRFYYKTDGYRGRF